MFTNSIFYAQDLKNQGFIVSIQKEERPKKKKKAKWQPLQCQGKQAIIAL